MARIVASFALLAACAPYVSAKAPSTVPESTIYLYKDSACNSFLSSYTVDDVFNKCTGVGTVNGYAVGGIPGCDPDMTAAYRTFTLYSAEDSGCTVSSDAKQVRGGGCGVDGQTCVATQDFSSTDSPAGFLTAGSTSSNLQNS